MEILLTRHTKIESSPKTFTLDTQFQPKTITLAELPNISAGQSVCTLAKITQPTDITTKQQDITIADHTSTATLILWEANIGTLEMTKTYLLTNLTVKQYQDRKFLSFGKSAAKELKPDITEVATDSTIVTTSSDRTLIGEITSVLSLINNVPYVTLNRS